MTSSSSSSSSKETALRLKKTAETAIKSIGLGYDVAVDLRLKYCKWEKERLVVADEDCIRDVVVPGGILVQNVPKSIRCDKGERTRFSSDILSFQQMSEQFNQDVCLSGKIPTGHFNSAFQFTGSWQKDAANTKALGLDGIFITLYSVALEKSQIALRDHVKQAVPSSWDPVALARFIEMFGTHVIVGVKIGGIDVVYAKQQQSSTLQTDEVQKKLKDVADRRFSDANVKYDGDPGQLERNDFGLISTDSNDEDITLFWRRRGGSNSRKLDHHTWCQTVPHEPDVISMSFVPISSLLSGLDGSGFMSHAINLYLRYKPPIEELQQFFEFQLPRQWAPVFGELAVGPERKQQTGASLQFSLLGPKLYVNTNLVDVGNRPVTGLRLYLEGKRNNCLAIHLQHLSSMPKSFQLKIEPKVSNSTNDNSYDKRYYEKVKWKSFSHICTAPVESDDDLSIVTGAEFEVKESGLKSLLFLRLHYAKVVNATLVKNPEWAGNPISQKSGFMSTLISTRFSTAQKQPPRPSDVNINSAIYPDGPPVQAQAQKLLRFVDTSEMTRGPQDLPGYWAVSGARLMVDNGKISLHVKYSLLAVVAPDDEVPL